MIVKAREGLRAHGDERSDGRTMGGAANINKMT
jgi:hypothetical protein